VPGSGTESPSGEGQRSCSLLSVEAGCRTVSSKQIWVAQNMTSRERTQPEHLEGRGVCGG
jgi:hypothetical protein